MNAQNQFVSLPQIKRDAKKLRNQDSSLSLSKAQEIIAQQYGYASFDDAVQNSPSPATPMELDKYWANMGLGMEKTTANLKKLSLKELQAFDCRTQLMVDELLSNEFVDAVLQFLSLTERSVELNEFFAKLAMSILTLGSKSYDTCKNGSYEWDLHQPFYDILLRILNNEKSFIYWDNVDGVTLLGLGEWIFSEHFTKKHEGQYVSDKEALTDAASRYYSANKPLRDFEVVSERVGLCFIDDKIYCSERYDDSSYGFPKQLGNCTVNVNESVDVVVLYNVMVEGSKVRATLPMNEDLFEARMTLKELRDLSRLKATRMDVNGCSAQAALRLKAGILTGVAMYLESEEDIARHKWQPLPPRYGKKVDAEYRLHPDWTWNALHKLLDTIRAKFEGNADVTKRKDLEVVSVWTALKMITEYVILQQHKGVTENKITFNDRLFFDAHYTPLNYDYPEPWYHVIKYSRYMEFSGEIDPSLYVKMKKLEKLGYLTKA